MLANPREYRSLNPVDAWSLEFRPGSRLGPEHIDDTARFGRICQEPVPRNPVRCWAFRRALSPSRDLEACRSPVFPTRAPTVVGDFAERRFGTSIVRVADLSGQSSCPRCVNLFGMWRVQRLDQINHFKPANPFDFKSLTRKFRSEQIGRFKTTIHPEQPDTFLLERRSRQRSTPSQWGSQCRQQPSRHCIL